MLDGQEVVFIQIGSNEGVMSTDPLCPLILEKGWKGILIEPVPRIFEKLKKNYEGIPGLYFENVAISDTSKRCYFYTIDPEAERFQQNPHLVNEAGGPWGDLVGSLSREHVFRCKPSLIESEVKAIEVRCVTLQEIVDQYQLKRIDVLHMDAEGQDEAILRSIDFTKIKPKIIIFEHVYIGPEAYLSCMAYLYSHGYQTLYTGPLDTVVCLS